MPNGLFEFHFCFVLFHLLLRPFRMIDFNTRNRRETEAETERLRSSQTAAERALESREKSHRSRVRSLEDQVNSIGNEIKHDTCSVCLI